MKSSPHQFTVSGLLRSATLSIATLALPTWALSQEVTVPEVVQTPGEDADKIFETLDKNDDGILERAEMASDRIPFFDRIVAAADVDGDESLSLAEFAKGLAAETESAAKSKGEGETPQFFSELDKNGDEKLSLDELDEKLRARLKPLFDALGKTEITEVELTDIRARAAAGQVANDRRAFFARLDVDKDGKIELDEVPERARQLVQALLDRQSAKTETTATSLTREEYLALVATGNDVVDPVEEPTAVGPGLIRALDVDGNGKLSKAELAAAASKFDLLDADRDGQVDARELLGAADSTGETAGGQTSDAEFARRIFESYDADKNGRLFKDELTEDSAARLEENFDRVDIDQDGSVSLEEFQTTITKIRGKSK